MRLAAVPLPWSGLGYFWAGLARVLFLSPEREAEREGGREGVEREREMENSGYLSSVEKRIRERGREEGRGGEKKGEGERVRWRMGSCMGIFLCCLRERERERV